MGCNEEIVRATRGGVDGICLSLFVCRIGDCGDLGARQVHDPVSVSPSVIYFVILPIFELLFFPITSR